MLAYVPGDAEKIYEKAFGANNNSDSIVGCASP